MRMPKNRVPRHRVKRDHRALRSDAAARMLFGVALTRADVLRTKSNASRGGVAQLVRALPCHGRGRGFESLRSRHIFKAFWPSFPKCRSIG